MPTMPGMYSSRSMAKPCLRMRTSSSRRDFGPNQGVRGMLIQLGMVEEVLQTAWMHVRQADFAARRGVQRDAGAKLDHQTQRPGRLDTIHINQRVAFGDQNRTGFPHGGIQPDQHVMTRQVVLAGMHDAQHHLPQLVTRKIAAPIQLAREIAFLLQIGDEAVDGGLGQAEGGVDLGRGHGTCLARQHLQYLEVSQTGRRLRAVLKLLHGFELANFTGLFSAGRSKVQTHRVAPCRFCIAGRIGAGTFSPDAAQ